MAKRMGRPPIEIDWDNFEKMCKMLCTAEEVASWHGCSVDTIGKYVKQKFGVTYSEVLKQYAAHGKVALRRCMMQMALKQDRNSVPILIYLDRKHSVGGETPPNSQVNINVDNRLPSTSESTVDLLREILQQPRLVTAGETNDT